VKKFDVKELCEYISIHAGSGTDVNAEPVNLLRTFVQSSNICPFTLRVTMQITNLQQVPPHEYTPAPQMRVPNRGLLPKMLPMDPMPKALDFDSSIPNIIVFGETGVGKSSIINMLQGGEVATTSNSAYGCTSESSHHEVTLTSRRSWVLLSPRFN